MPKGHYKRTKKQNEKISKKIKEQWEKGLRKKGMYKHTEEFKNKQRERRIGCKHSLETLKKMSNAQKGERGSGWRGGLLEINKKLRKSLEYRLWRESVFKRDNYTCIWFGARSGNGKTIIIQADHIKRFAYYPELRFSIDNGRTLCVPCHKTTGTWGRPKKYD